MILRVSRHEGKLRDGRVVSISAGVVAHGVGTDRRGHVLGSVLHHERHALDGAGVGRVGLELAQ